MSSPFFARMLAELDRSRTCRVVIPLAQDEACAYAVQQGLRLGILAATLIGDPGKITAMYGEAAGHERVTVVEEKDPQLAARLACQHIREGKADFLMKGLVNTPTYLKAVLNSKEGLKKNPLLSHLLFFETNAYPGMRILSDVAINIAPDADTLTGIVENAAEAFTLFESRPPRVALLSANEKVSDKVPSTQLARQVSERFANRKDVVVEGPISLDLALSPESAGIKKYYGRIQGDADIFVVPRIEAGNVMYKALHYFADAAMGSIVFGAQCPMVLTSRADTNETKFQSLLMGAVLWQRAAKAREKGR
ncbi:MAG: phosphate butyryltransferase [Candidatus Riflebacteria bacterium]|nr:phosphate butyryltransferase [Candidatus Riflebacteria bacterium]